MNPILIVQIIVAILLITAILLQSQGSGLGSAWGGAGESYHTRRGVEKILFVSTIILSIVFTILAIFALL